MSSPYPKSSPETPAVEPSVGQCPESMVEIDAIGLACPLPLLKAKQGLKALVSGECLRLLATDPGSVRDIQAFVDLSDHQLLAFDERDGRYTYTLKKA